MGRVIVGIICIFFSNTLKSQDTIILKYSIFSKYNVRGFSLNKAKENKSYVIGKDFFRMKRVEGRLNTDGFPYLGKKIRYYKNGKIKSIEIYTDKSTNYKSVKVGKWQYFDKKGALIKEINYD
jgi:hypothetical protein